jgi:hypothetical protein
VPRPQPISSHAGSLVGGITPKASSQHVRNSVACFSLHPGPGDPYRLLQWHTIFHLWPVVPALVRCSRGIVGSPARCECLARGQFLSRFGVFDAVCVHRFSLPSLILASTNIGYGELAPASNTDAVDEGENLAQISRF